MLQYAEHSLWYVVHHHVEVDLIGLVSLRIECMLQSNHIWVVQFLHNLQFTILVSLILVYLLDGHLIIILIDCGLEDDTKRAIAYDSISIVSETCGFLVFVVTSIGTFIHF